MSFSTMADEYLDEEDEFKTPQVTEKKKKRKRKITSETEKHDEDTTMVINVKQISEKPDRASPIVAYFASGYDPCAQSANPSVTVYKRKAESKKRLQVMVSPPGSSVEFVGSYYAGEQATRQNCVYTLGILDKETQTLKILPIANEKVLRLEPRVKVRETVDSDASRCAEINEISEAERLVTARNKLNSSFGTTEANNRDKKKRALNLGNDPEAQKSLDGKLSKVDVNTSALESTSSIIARNIPPYNASATTPREAYPLEKIIDSAEWVALQDVYKMQQETIGETDAYPVFVRNRLYRLQDIKDETEKETISGVLSFLTHLIKFKDMNSMNGFDSAKGHRFPGMIRQKCKSLFKDSETDKMPIEKINLLISYVLVLTLHVDMFKTDPEDIAKDLRMSKVELRKHFENLGCKLSVEKGTTLASLPVPLKFPEIFRRRRR